MSPSKSKQEGGVKSIIQASNFALGANRFFKKQLGKVTGNNNRTVFPNIFKRMCYLFNIYQLKLTIHQSGALLSSLLFLYEHN